MKRIPQWLLNLIYIVLILLVLFAIISEEMFATVCLLIIALPLAAYQWIKQHQLNNKNREKLLLKQAKRNTNITETAPNETILYLRPFKTDANTVYSVNKNGKQVMKKKKSKRFLNSFEPIEYSGVLYGNISFTEKGISYRSSSLFIHLLMKINLVNKFFWKICEDKTIPYKDIIDVQRFEKNKIKIITNDINGSYYLSFQSNITNFIDDIIDFINNCRRISYNSAMNDSSVNAKKVLEVAEKAKKSLIPAAIVLTVIAIASLLKNKAMISLIIGLFASGTSKQTEKYFLYFISLVCFLASLIKLFTNDI